MKKIEPYSKVWLNCNNNLKLSLLMSVNEEYESRGYENLYEYVAGQEKSGGGVEFNYLTVKQPFYSYNTFSDVVEKNFSNESDFKKCIINQLKLENGYVLVYVDLHDWLEGSVSWKKFHWEHYSLLVDYNPEKKSVVAFDELQGQYVKFEVDIDRLFSCLSNNKRFSQLRLITLKKNFSLPQISREKLHNNAKDIIESISNIRCKEFWKMSDNDFRARSHMEVNGVYLQQLDGRQEANKKLVDMVIQAGNVNSQNNMRKIRNSFLKLAENWRSIRMELYRVYFDDVNREQLLKHLNHAVKICLAQEQELWHAFIKNIS